MVDPDASPPEAAAGLFCRSPMTSLAYHPTPPLLSAACSLGHKAKAVVLLFVVLLSEARGQQMSPAQMQQMMQQQQSGGQGGPPATPNRIGQILSAAGASSAALTRAVRDHPRTAAAATVAATTAVYVGTETRRSGLLVCRSPRVSLFKPSDKYLTDVLESAAEAPVSRPLRGVILMPLEDPEGEEESPEEKEGSEERSGDTAAATEGSRRTGGGHKRKLGRSRRGGRQAVGGGSKRNPRSSSYSSSRSRGSDRYAAGVEKEQNEKRSVVPIGIQKVIDEARAVEAAGVYTKEATHGGEGEGKVKAVCAGVRVGRGLGLYHKFAQGLGKLDVFDGRSDCELIAAESSSEGLGSTLGLLSRPSMGMWSLCPLRVVLLRETTSPARSAVAHVTRTRKRKTTREKNASRGGGIERVSRSSSGRRRRRDGADRKKKSGGGVERKRRSNEERDEGESEEDEEMVVHRQFSLALSAVEGAGWSGTWLFRVTYDAETDDVWFETSLAQRQGIFGSPSGGGQASRVKRVNDDMVERGNKHARVLRTREEQLGRISSLSRARARDARALERDRILNPDKYKRVHRWMREDSHTTGGATARPARWGEERRRSDIRLK